MREGSSLAAQDEPSPASGGTPATTTTSGGSGCTAPPRAAPALRGPRCAHRQMSRKCPTRGLSACLSHQCRQSCTRAVRRVCRLVKITSPLLSQRVPSPPLPPGPTLDRLWIFARRGIAVPATGAGAACHGRDNTTGSARCWHQRAASEAGGCLQRRASKPACKPSSPRRTVVGNNI